MIETLTYTQWIIISLTALCIGMSKTGVQGLMLMMVPLMAISFGAKESTGVILPMLCMADIIAVAYYRRFDWSQKTTAEGKIKIVAKLLPSAIIGFFLAITVDSFIEKGQFRHLMGWTLMSALMVMIWSEIYGKENKWMRKWWYAGIFGLLGGFTTMIGNAAGPVMSVYLLSMKKDKMEYIGINAWFFLVVNLLKVPLQVFAWNNITWDSIELNIFMLPVIGTGAVIGIYLVKLIPEMMFRRFVQIVTIISVLIMII